MAVTLHAHTMSAVLSGNRGAVGVGIADITFNDDYTMTITLTDGSTYTSGNLRGAQGIPGIDAEYDGEELVITTGDHTETDGGDVSAIRVKGEARVIRDRITEEMALAEYPTRKIAGDLIHITDAAEAPLKSLSITLTPTQSGTGDPSPTNIRPISGVDSVVVSRTGKNLCDLSALAKGYYTDADFTITQATSAVFRSYKIYLKAGTYTFWFAKNVNVIRAIYDGSMKTNPATDVNTLTITATADGFVGISWRDTTSSTTNWDDTTPIQLEAGSVATEYESFGQTYSVSLPQTVYSGVVDVTGGTVTFTHAEIVLDGTEGWGYQDGMFYTGGKHASIAYPDGYCDTYKVVKSYAAMQSGDFVISSTTTVIRVKDSRYTDAASFQANIAQNPVKFIWQLATPQVIQLTPQEITTLLNENYIWANSGTLALTYHQKFDVRLTEAVAKVLPTETVTGDIVSITDGAEDIPVKALTIEVEPKQAGSGDPSPDNVRAISGWDAVNVVRTGKNLIDMKGLNHTSGTVTAMTFLKKGTYYVYQFSGSSAHNTSFYYSLDGTNKTIIPTTDDGYAVAALSSASYNRQKNMITLHQDCYFALSILGNASIGENPIDVMVTTDGTGYDSFPNNAGSLAYKDSMYEPYVSTTYPIPLPSTVYGGTLDVASGVMTVDRAMANLGDFTWTVSTSGRYSRFVSGNLVNVIEPTSASTEVTIAVCSQYKAVKFDTTYTANTDMVMSVTNVQSGASGKINIVDSRFDNVNDFKAAMDGVQFAYPLKNPYTITLDPTTISTLLGNNSIYADAGQVTVRYRADVGLYIDKRIAEVQALVLES